MIANSAPLRRISNTRGPTASPAGILRTVNEIRLAEPETTTSPAGKVLSSIGNRPAHPRPRSDLRCPKCLGDGLGPEREHRRRPGNRRLHAHSDCCGDPLRDHLSPASSESVNDPHARRPGRHRYRCSRRIDSGDRRCLLSVSDRLGDLPEVLDEGGALRSGSLVRMWNRPQVQAVNVCEISWIAGEERKIVGERHGGDHRIVRPGTGLASSSVERCGDTTECPGCRRIEGEGIEVGLSLLQPKLACRLFSRVRCHQGTNGELCEGDSRNERLGRERPWVSDPLEQHHGAGVEDSPIPGAHSDGSMRASMSRRSDSGSIAGSCDHRSTSTSIERGARPRGTRSATGLPSRVTVIRSPWATRSTMSPPWFRSSRIEISVTGIRYHP